MQKIIEAIAVTAELMQQQISPVAAAAMAYKLQGYDQAIVLKGLDLLSESKEKFTLAAVKEKIESINPNARLGAEEAWAMIPKNESDSAVITNEMAEAMGSAIPLWDDGDRVGARMAFKEAYNRIVEAAKRENKPFSWFPSLGHDKAGRVPALAEAVRLGRLQSSDALKLIAPEHAQTMLALAGEKTLALEYKPDEKSRALNALTNQGEKNEA